MDRPLEGRKSSLPPISELAARCRAGDSLKDVAAEFGVAYSTLSARFQAAGFAVSGQAFARPKLERLVSQAVRPDWMDEAMCTGRPGDLWFEDHSRRTAAAVEICKECPVADLCLQWALDTGEGWGVWGGKTAKERDLIRRREGYAKKPKKSPVRVLSPVAAADAADRAAKNRTLKSARAAVVGSVQLEADEVANRFTQHRAGNTPLLASARRPI